MLNWLKVNCVGESQSFCKTCVFICICTYSCMIILSLLCLVMCVQCAHAHLHACTHTYMRQVCPSDKCYHLLLNCWEFQTRSFRTGAPAGKLSWLQHHPIHQKVVGSNPSWGIYRRQPIDVSLSSHFFCL